MGDDAARAAAAAQPRCARAINRTVLRTHDPRAAAAARHRSVPAVDVLAEHGADYVGTLGEDARGLLLRRRVVDVHATSIASRPSPPSARCSSKVDAVFAINHALAEAKRQLNPRDVRVAARRRPRAVRDARSTPRRSVPPTSPRCPRPRIGFYGTLRDWVDFELIAHVARARPDVVRSC